MSKAAARASTGETKRFAYGLNRQSILHRARRHWFTFVQYNSLRKMWNLARVLVAYALGRTVVRGHPFMLKMEPTSRCNLSCKGCIAHGTDFPIEIGDMQMNTFTRVVDELASYLYKISLYITGEPLIHRGIYEMIRYATDRRVGTVVSTNFHPFRPDRADEMIDSGLSHLIVCLDGLTQEVYGSYRVGGKVETVLANLEALARRKRERGARTPFIEVQTIHLPQNEAEIPKIAELAERLGVERFTVREDLREHQPASKASRCFWLWFTALIREDGVVLPCCPAAWQTGESQRFGSVLERPFREIWNGPAYVKARRIFRGAGPRAALADSFCFACNVFRPPAVTAADQDRARRETARSQPKPEA